jgi:hypothetical protein
MTTEIPSSQLNTLKESTLGKVVTFIGYRLIKLPHQDASGATLSYCARDEVASLEPSYKS